MKAEDLFDKLTDVDEKYIKQSRTYPKKTGKWISTIAAGLAACLILGIFVSINNTSIPSAPGEPIVIEQLTVITLDSANTPFLRLLFNFDADMMRYSGNPWYEEAELDTLPVMALPLVDLSLDERTSIGMAMLEAFESELGILGTMLIEFPGGGQVVDMAREQGPIVVIEVSPLGSVVIWFDPRLPFVRGDLDPPEQGFPLPEDMVFFSRYPSLEAVEYIIERFAPILNMESPTAVIDLHSAFMNLPRMYGHSIFDDAGENLTERILNYHFSRVHVDANNMSDTPELMSMSFSGPLRGIIGYYPIITMEEARERLLLGYYLSGVTERPREENIAYVELTYRACPAFQFSIPVYEFIVRLSPNYILALHEQNALEIQIHGMFEIPSELQIYGVFQVPAIADEYLYWLGQTPTIPERNFYVNVDSNELDRVRRSLVTQERAQPVTKEEAAEIIRGIWEEIENPIWTMENIIIFEPGQHVIGARAQLLLAEGTVRLTFRRVGEAWKLASYTIE